MTAVVNGKPCGLRDGMTVAEVVATVTDERRGVVVAVNRTIVSRRAWTSTVVGSGDRIEILTASQGG